MRFQKITLQAASLAALRNFYGETLGLNVHYEDAHAFEVITGPTTLRFSEAVEDEPFYHFAFNIPENQLAEATAWLQSKGIELLQEPETQRTILDFTDWDAHAVYFYDPAGNLLELIARHQLNNASTGPFGAASFIEVSEIGVVAKDYPATYKYITQQLNVPFWRGNQENFSALGDEHGLLITVNEGRTWFMSGNEARCFPLEINFTQDGINQTVNF